MRVWVVVWLLAVLVGGCAGHDARLPAKPWLNMPETANGPVPALLSQTGVFADLQRLQPSATLLPYDLVLAFWSDGATKSRLVAIPDAKVAFSPTGEWRFPPGTVFVKTFERQRRLETRLLVVDRNGGVYGVTYKWRADLSDAELVGAQGLHEGSWYYPSRADCLVCHNSHTNGVLGPKTRQMDREQLLRWNRLGLFDTQLTRKEIESFPTLARSDDMSRSVEDRARSWLDANCGHCHRPGGTVANFDARYETPLAEQNLIEGPLLIDENIDRARVISPHDPWRSVALMRVDTDTDIRMPPLARNSIDKEGAALLRAWIESLPGRDVVPPPSIAPVGGNFDRSINVTIASSEPGAEIRYTLDGSVPGPKDALYAGPIRIEGSATLRARAYKNGMTRSIIAQQTYLIGQ